jgi:hypothetical protein
MFTRKHSPSHGLRGAAVLTLGCLWCFGLQGCNDAQAGLLLGAGGGALAGQAIGHSTTATLVGTGIGAGLGYIIGNESDKDRDRYCRHRYYDY